MKKGLCNKLLTVLCALVLCMSIVPVTSFAEGTAVDVTTAAGYFFCRRNGCRCNYGRAAERSAVRWEDC